MKGIRVLAFAAVSTLVAHQAMAESGGSFFFRGGLGWLSKNRGSQIFTDTSGASGTNKDSMGFNIGAGFNHALSKMGPGTVLGEISVDYSEFSRKNVVQAAPALSDPSAPIMSKVSVSQLTVMVAPKYSFDQIADGKFRPWLMPAGLAFLVASPPSNDSTVTDIGYGFGAGLEYSICQALSLGADLRYIIAFERNHIKGNSGAANAYVAFNF